MAADGLAVGRMEPIPKLMERLVEAKAKLVAGGFS
jgi:hypothetical protein